MRIHTNKLTWIDLRQAADKAGVTLLRDSEHGSGTHARAFDVILSGSSARAVNPGTARYAARGREAERAATWDEWGVFLGELFRQDPSIKCWAYESAADFHAQTGNRFRAFLPVADRCPRHRWENLRAYVSQCKKCKATLDRSEKYGKASA